MNIGIAQLFARKAQLAILGFVVDGDSYLFEKLRVSHLAVTDLNEEAWSRYIEELIPLVQQVRIELEEKIKEDKQ